MTLSPTAAAANAANADIDPAKVKKNFIPWLVSRGHRQRHAEDACKVYFRLLDSWRYYHENKQLQVAVDPPENDPHLHLGPSFFSSKDQFLTHRLKGWTRHRFETAVNILRQEGLVCTQTRGIQAKTISSGGAVFGGRARHWWLIKPTDKEKRQWVLWFNSQLDAAHKQAHQQHKQQADNAQSLDSERLTSVAPVSISDTGVLRISEHRCSENQRIGAPNFSAHTPTYSTELNHLPTESSAIDKRLTHDTQTGQVNSVQDQQPQQPQGKSPVEALLSNADTPTPSAALLDPLLTPKATDTTYRDSFAPQPLLEPCRAAWSVAISLAHELNANYCGVGISDADRSQLLASAAASLEYNSPDQLIQCAADALSYAEAHYWYHQRPLRNPAALLNKAISGGITPTVSSVDSDSYGTPDLIWDPDRLAFVATDSQYCGDNFLATVALPY